MPTARSARSELARTRKSRPAILQSPLTARTVDPLLATQPVETRGTVLACFRSFRADSICYRLPPVATTGLHKGSSVLLPVLTTRRTLYSPIRVGSERGSAPRQDHERELGRWSRRGGWRVRADDRYERRPPTFRHYEPGGDERARHTYLGGHGPRLGPRRTHTDRRQPARRDAVDGRRSRAGPVAELSKDRAITVHRRASLG